MLNTHKLQRFALATSALMALGSTQPISHAETVSITGDIQGSTCELISPAKGGGPTSRKFFKLPLGTFDLTEPSTAAAAGNVFGTVQTLEFRLNAPGSSSACTFENGTAGWELSIAPTKSGFITTIGTSTFLSNMVSLSDGGTDAVVKLTGGFSTSILNEIEISETGSFVRSQNKPFRAQATSSIFLGAQFAQPVANQKPNSGVYSSTLTISVVYR